jgi:hypothetical protein
MDLFEMLMGGGKNKHEYEDFASRYDQGHPSEGIPMRKYWSVMVQ